MTSYPSDQDRGELFRESIREEGLARDAEREAARRGDYAEADYWFAMQWAWRDKAATLRAEGR